MTAPSPSVHLGVRLWNSAWTLLIACNLLWAGNIVISRAIVHDVPPFAYTFFRWAGAFAVGLAFAWPHLRRDWPVLLRCWRMQLLLAALGFGAYNAMTYIGLASTTAINALLLQSAMPLIVLLWAFALFRDMPSTRQTLGVLLSLAGVAAIASRGSLTDLLALSLNRGDVWVLAAVVLYGLYTTLLRRRPPVHPLSFLVAAMGIGAGMVAPLAWHEAAAGARITGGWPDWLALAYAAVLPAFAAYLFFNRGVELIGAARAGQSVHLMPLFGTLLAVVFLGEAFRTYDAAGIALIGAGILLASRRPAPRRAAVPRSA